MYVCGRTNFGQSPIRSVIWQKLMTGVRQGFVLSCYLLSDAWCSDRDLFRSNHLTVGPPLYSTVTFTSYLQKLNHPYHLIESRFVSPNKVIGLRLTRSDRHSEQFFACVFVENSCYLQRFFTDYDLSENCFRVYIRHWILIWAQVFQFFSRPYQCVPLSRILIQNSLALLIRMQIRPLYC